MLTSTHKSGVTSGLTVHRSCDHVSSYYRTTPLVMALGFFDIANVGILERNKRTRDSRYQDCDVGIDEKVD